IAATDVTTWRVYSRLYSTVRVSSGVWSTRACTRSRVISAAGLPNREVTEVTETTLRRRPSTSRRLRRGSRVSGARDRGITSGRPGFAVKAYEHAGALLTADGAKGRGVLVPLHEILRPALVTCRLVVRLGIVHGRSSGRSRKLAEVAVVQTPRRLLLRDSEFQLWIIDHLDEHPGHRVGLPLFDGRRLVDQALDPSPLSCGVAGHKLRHIPGDAY